MMFQKIAKHRANDASHDVHRPPLPTTQLTVDYSYETIDETVCWSAGGIDGLVMKKNPDCTLDNLG